MVKDVYEKSNVDNPHADGTPSSISFQHARKAGQEWGVGTLPVEFSGEDMSESREIDCGVYSVEYKPTPLYVTKPDSDHRYEDREVPLVYYPQAPTPARSPKY